MKDQIRCFKRVTSKDIHDDVVNKILVVKRYVHWEHGQELNSDMAVIDYALENLIQELPEKYRTQVVNES